MIIYRLYQIEYGVDYTQMLAYDLDVAKTLCAKNGWFRTAIIKPKGELCQNQKS